jgi:uncharacterized membrane protein YgaE (UPF0421/DUF939 family)
MISEVDKHRASTLQVAGFGLMAPLGNLFVNFLNYNFLNMGIKLLIFIPVAFFLFYLGIICLARSQEILEEMEKQ